MEATLRNAGHVFPRPALHSLTQVEVETGFHDSRER